MKPKLSVCNPGKTNTTALGFQPLSQSVVEGVEKFVFFVGYQRGQPPRLALSDSKGRATNKTRPPTLNHRDKTDLERDVHIQARQMLRDQTSFNPLQNVASS